MDLKRFADYRNEVINAYKKQKLENKLSPNLERHTPAKLKNECLALFAERYSERDYRIFKSWFSKGNDQFGFLKELEYSNPNIYKPLNTFLKNNVNGGTSDKNIELLAWLIDFPHRPHRAGDIYEIVKNEREFATPTFIPQSKADTLIEDVKQGGDREDSTNFTPREDVENEKENEPLLLPIANFREIDKQRFGLAPKFFKTVVAFIGALIILGGSYILYDGSKHQCMYWKKDHYESVACDQKIDATAIIALDTFRLAHLRKINISSIKKSDIGKVYYSKIDGIVEFYSSNGENPTDSRRRLLPMTEYMYEKYVLKNKSK